MQIKDLSKELEIGNADLIKFFKENDFEVKNHMSSVTSEMEELARGSFEKTVPVVTHQPRVFQQTDLVLCRSITPGWLGVPGKSGQYYVFTNVGDEQEIEYQDLFALKNARSRYIYDPLFIIEDDELLETPRWKDLAAFYEDKVYGMDDINEVLNVSNQNFKAALESLPRGLRKALTVEVAKRIEEGTFDSLKKINMIDDVCGTDFKHIISMDD